MRRILISFVLLLACSLVFVGCGGSSKSKSKNSSENVSANIPGAEVAPANALAFISISTDSTGAQWQQAMKLLDRVPALKTALNKNLASSGMSLTDLAQALGKSTDVVLFGNAKKPMFVMLTEPNDAAKLKSLLAKGSGSSGTKPVTTMAGSWLLAADTQTALDKFQSDAGTGKLSDSATYKQAVSELPSDALVRVYAPGASIAQALESLATSSAKSSSSSGSSLSLSPKTLVSVIKKNQLDWASLSVGAVPDGFTLKAVLKGKKSVSGAGGSLVNELPSGTAFAVDLNGKTLGLDKAVNKLRSNAKYGAQVTQMEAALGVKLEDVAALVGSEMAIYGTSSGIGLLIKAPDPAKASLLINKVVTLLSAQLSGGVKKVTVAGVQASELKLGTLKLDVGVKDGDLFLTTDASALPGSTKLSSDPLFAAATKALPIPASTDGVLYLDFAGVAALGKSNNSLVKSLSKSLSSGLKSSSNTPMVSGATTSLESFSSLLGFVAPNGDKVDIEVLLTVK